MFVTSTLSMSGQQQNAENERQHLLDRLLDAVKQCQVRFGGKTELATDGDSRVVCLLTQFEAVFQHGFKKTRVSAFRQVGQVAGIVKLDSEAVFWSFVKVHLGKLEEERFHSLQKATTNAARGRAWLRSALNEHSLEKSLLQMLGTKPVLSQFYENDAFFMDEERASMLPMIAAGLSPILFALTVDSEELNIIRQQPPSLTINKDVFSNILPSFPHKPVVEPAPVYSAALTDYFSQERRKKKKKKKKRNAAIVSIEDDNQQDFVNDSMEFPLSDASVKETVNSSCDCKRSSLGHSRSSSYPGNITVGTEGSAVKTSRMNGQDIVFTEITKSISLPDNSVPVESVEEVNQAKGKTTILNLENLPENVCVEPRYDAVGESLQEAPTAEDTGNFVFGAAEFLKRSNAEQKEMLSQNHNNGQRLTGSVITVDAANVIKESNKVKETGLPQLPIVIDSESGNFQTSFSSSVVIQDPKNKQEKLSQKKHNTDFYYPCNLKDDGDKESNYSIVRMETASVVEKTVADHDTKASNESGEPYSVIEQEHQAFRNSPSENTTLQEGIGENEALYENTANDFAEFEPSRSPKSQAAANNGEVEPLLLMDSGEYLVPVAGSDLASKTVAQSTFYDVPEVSVENDVDSLSSTSWPCVEDPECLSENTYDWPLNTSTRSVAMVSDASAEAALAACSDAQRGMDNMARGGFVTIERTTGDRGINRDSSRSRHDSMSTGELKQALVSMMLRKDDTEQQNRSLQSELGKEREKSQELGTKNEQLQDEIKQQENFNAAKIASLSRENELLKHQLKKYVGAVQALRSDLQGRATETAEVLSGIRQDEILPPLPPEQATEQARLSEEAEEYKRKLIQVADLHGELLEFNERLHKQLSYYQHKVRRLREELVHLRGPLPEDTESLDDVEASLSDFDPAVMSVGTRPLVNVWIPSVFLRGRPSNEHHVYQVYVRIKDDEWNIYRRYSQFFDMHKSLRQKFPVVDTFQFPPKKTLGNKDTRFVEDRRRLLQDYLRRVVNLCVTTDRQLRDNTSKTVLLQIIPFFGEPFPPQKTKNASSRRKRSLKYDGL